MVYASEFHHTQGSYKDANCFVEHQTIGYLTLEDGTKISGISFGADVAVSGEVVFTTSMVGYPESFTDPSYKGQILVLTYPLVGNYGVPGMQKDKYGLPLHFESDRIHIAGLIVQDYSHNYSHWQAACSLSKWLKSNGIPALYNVDTRHLTKKLRHGSKLGRITFSQGDLSLPFFDPNSINIVSQVTATKVREYGDISNPKVIVLDCGMKASILRCLLERNLFVKVVPFDYNFLNEKYDGLFISNGPGDARKCVDTIEHIRQAYNGNAPIFGICLGNQLMSLAANAEIYKMKFGNRGHNQPCIHQLTGRCYITSQNHGFAVRNESLAGDWAPLFLNANDGSNEGIYHKKKPFFSVQFHPEACGGPLDTINMFDQFAEYVRAYNRGDKIQIPIKTKIPVKRTDIKKVIILGSGGLTIGQAGEFDYSGSQCIKALKEEGIETVLINPNIATVQTSKDLADKVYFVAVTPEQVENVIIKEKPDGILLSFGGQTGLNCGVKLHQSGILDKYGVRVLGTPISAIVDTEDRDRFNVRMREIDEKIATGCAVNNIEDALIAANRIGYPVIARAAFALGGLGSGFANNDEQLKQLAQVAFSSSPQLLIERSVKGWKEVEYEVVRDAYDNCIVVCNMENFDPVGVHTGESIVVCPSQTLTNQEYHMLRTTAIKVIRHLGIVGECNIQYALNPSSLEYVIIEVNARLSRSSALASKATGYPLAFVAAKLSLGIELSSIHNSVTKDTTACFEPSLDYCVVKMPRWDLNKFRQVSREIGSAMKSVGEVMAIGRTFEETIQKAIRMVDTNYTGFDAPKLQIYKSLDNELTNPTDKRIFAIADALQNHTYSVDKLNRMTGIDKWFLYKLQNISETKKRILTAGSIKSISSKLMREAKKLGFSDSQIANYVNSSELDIRKLRLAYNIRPTVKQIDTTAGEYSAQTNYLYTTYASDDHHDDVSFDDQGIIVLGSGVYRIGSSVEFDYCAVMCVRTLQQMGHKTIMINYNPETVSTDYDESDRLYFEELSLERVLDIYQSENSAGLILSMGGQQPNNIAMGLANSNVKIFGTDPKNIDRAENRKLFSTLLDSIGVDQPQWSTLFTLADAKIFATSVGYPVLIRPSYVLSGAAMNVAHDENQLISYLQYATHVSPNHPVVISKFICNAKEIEIDGVASNGQLVVHAISEHIENAGIHSGDAHLVLPPHTLSEHVQEMILEYTKRIVSNLNISGPFNLQYLSVDSQVKVIECNVRASRSFPFVSKTTNVDFINIATRAIMNEKLKEVKIPKFEHCAVKVPIFSFKRLDKSDPSLGVEMASTGEVACFGRTFQEAFMKGILSAGFTMPKRKNLLVATKKADIHKSLKLLNNFTIFELDENSIQKIGSEIDIVLDVPESDESELHYLIRRRAINYQVPLFNNYQIFEAFASAFNVPLITEHYSEYTK
jgi:carbamoyl-phosphate synthase large subunit/carbamoyl-phosphate synthase small subunit